MKPVLVILVALLFNSISSAKSLEIYEGITESPYGSYACVTQLLRNDYGEMVGLQIQGPVQSWGEFCGVVPNDDPRKSDYCNYFGNGDDYMFTEEGFQLSYEKYGLKSISYSTKPNQEILEGPTNVEQGIILNIFEATYSHSGLEQASILEYRHGLRQFLSATYPRNLKVCSHLRLVDIQYGN